MMLLGLLTLIGSLISALPIEAPELDPTVLKFGDLGWNYIMNAINILGTFIGPTGMNAIKIYLSLIIVINAFYFAWQLFNFIIKKIPFLNYRP